MRDAFCRLLVEAARRPEFVFLTGDLGFMALEPLRDALGPRFINAGVAEQNMVSVAAGLARSGLRPWAYSIAPFVYARPFEQVRNDVCLHRLPVVLVGNGGGYGYGVMGATHHAIEDYGALLGLPDLRAFVPAFDEDLSPLFDRLFEADRPSYVRLGLSEKPKDADVPPFAPWRRLLDGLGWVVLVCGPLVGGIWDAARYLDDAHRPALWLLGELPPAGLPEPFLADLARSGRLLVVEEHVEHGGVGQMVAAALLASGHRLERFASRSALGHVSGRYGSQKFHRRESGLDPASIVEFLRSQDGP
jgi:transketolase